MKNIANKLIKLILVTLVLMTQIQPITVNAKPFREDCVYVTIDLNFLKTPSKDLPEQVRIQVVDEENAVMNDAESNENLNEVFLLKDNNYRKEICIDKQLAEQVHVVFLDEDIAFGYSQNSTKIFKNKVGDPRWEKTGDGLEEGSEYILTVKNNNIALAVDGDAIVGYQVQENEGKLEIPKNKYHKKGLDTFEAVHNGVLYGNERLIDLKNTATNKYMSYDFDESCKNDEFVLPVQLNDIGLKKYGGGYRPGTSYKLDLTHPSKQKFYNDIKWSINTKRVEFCGYYAPNNSERDEIQYFKKIQDHKYTKTINLTVEKLSIIDHKAENMINVEDDDDFLNEYSDQSIKKRQDRFMKVKFKQEFENIKGIGEVDLRVEDRNGHLLKDAVTNEPLERIKLNIANGFEAERYLYLGDLDSKINIITDIDPKYHVAQYESKLDSEKDIRYLKANTLFDGNEYIITNGKDSALGVTEYGNFTEELYPIKIENNEIVDIDENAPVLFKAVKKMFIIDDASSPTGKSTIRKMYLSIGDKFITVQEDNYRLDNYLLENNEKLGEFYIPNDEVKKERTGKVQIKNSTSPNDLLWFTKNETPHLVQRSHPVKEETVVFEKIKSPIIKYTLVASRDGKGGDYVDDMDKEITDVEELISESEANLKLTNTATKRPGTDIYDVKFGVKGNNVGATKDTPLDVVIVLDNSGSMQRDMGQQNQKTYLDENTRWTKLGNSLTTMFDNLKGQNISYSMIGFSAGNQQYVTDPGEQFKAANLIEYNTKNLYELKSYLKKEEPTGGGTNYEAAFEAIKREQLLDSKAGRRKAKKVVLFVTDGQPADSYAKYEPWDPKAYDYYWGAWYQEQREKIKEKFKNEPYNIKRYTEDLDACYIEDMNEWYNQWNQFHKDNPKATFLGTDLNRDANRNPDPNFIDHRITPRYHFLYDNISFYSNKRKYGKNNVELDEKIMGQTLDSVSSIDGMDMFYTIGLGNEIEGSGPTFDTIVEYANAPHKGQFIAGDESSLIDTFKKITDNIKAISYDMESIKISYPLSQYCEPNSDNGDFVITMKNESTGLTFKKKLKFKDLYNTGVKYSLEEFGGEPKDGVSINYNPVTKTVELEFTPGYKLSSDCTLDVEMEVRPSETAKVWIKENIKEDEGTYPHKADNNTGTHSNDLGLFVNRVAGDINDANISYQTGNGKKKKIVFPKPVIRASKYQPVYVPIRATKTFINGTLVGNDFNFTLSSVGRGVDNTIEIVSNNQDGSIVFSDLKFTSPGVYNFVMKESAPRTINPLVTIDHTKKKVEVSITANADKTLNYDVNYLNGNNFINELHEPREEGIKFKVVLKGMRLTHSLFTYDLYDQNDTVIETVGCNADGTIVFSEIKPGNTYTIKPVIHGKNHPEFIEFMHYDGVNDYESVDAHDCLTDHGKTITFKINNDKTIVDVNDNHKLTDEEVTFINRYQIRAGIE